MFTETPDSGVQSSLPGYRLAIPGEQRTEPWEDDALRMFEARMLDKADPFPCVFGVDAVRRKTLRYCFVPSGHRRVAVLAQALGVFAARCADLGKRTSMVAFFTPDDGLSSVEDYRQEFWRLLAGLAASDDQARPSGIDGDPDSPEWEFWCFGVPFFVVANTPYHEERRSRFFEYFTITFQPRFVFDDLAANTLAGRNGRKVIRRRLADYDTVPAYPELGSFGEPGNREWVQYYLPDDNQPVPRSEKCPMSVMGDPT